MSNLLTTAVEGSFIINRPVFEDPRGFFRETFRMSELEQAVGSKIEFVQGNHSRSQQHTLRGIHIAPWHKLVTVTHGLVQQVVVDTRPSSPTFGQHFQTLLGEQNWQSVFVPAGCGNAFLVLSETADYNYITTMEWQAGLEQNLAWNDSKLKISWQSEAPQLSDKDAQNPTWQELFHD